jgi:hypothetical protein
LIEGSAYPVANVIFTIGTAGALLAQATKLAAFSISNLEVRFTTDHKMDDGRFANNGWLQECPDPITKISWENAILISPRLAQELNIYPRGSLLQVARVEADTDAAGKEQTPIAEVTVGGRKIRGPVHIQPGLSNYTLILPLGYGRTQAGHIGTNAGFSAYPLRTTEAMHLAGGATIKLTDELVLLANTQLHWSMEGRDLVREANKEEYDKNPAYVKEIGMEAETPSNLGEVGEKMSL